MRKLFVALAGVSAVAAFTVPAAAKGAPKVSVSAEAGDECGTVVLNLIENHDYKSGFLAQWSSGGADTTEGVHKGTFTGTKTLTLVEDTHGGEAQVIVRVYAGPEPDDYLKPGGKPGMLGGSWKDVADHAKDVVVVSTDCEQKPTEEPTPSETPSTEPTAPSDDQDGKDDGGDHAKPVDLPGNGDEANEDGSAPTPTPQPGHLDVTG
jgi:hypothetical protein